MFREKLKEAIAEAAAKVLGEQAGLAAPKFSVEVPENPEHGDYASNVALVLSKLVKQKPMDIASKIATGVRARNLAWLSKIETVPPGFVNFFINDGFLLKGLGERLSGRADALALADWAGRKVMVEFTDPNPFKEFHVGHLYSNIVGEALCRIFEAGGAVVRRANYQGDVGLHVAKALWGMQKKIDEAGLTLEMLAKEDLEARMKFLGRAYAAGAAVYDDGGEEAKKEIIALNKKIFTLDPDIKEFYAAGREWSLEYFGRIYRRLGTKFDFYYFESEVGKVGFELVKENLEKGVFEESEGAVVFPGEKYGLHRRVFINSEGLPTYEAKELGLAPTKYKDFPHDLSIIITGSEVIDYFKVLLAALKEINPELAEKTAHIAHGMVRLASGKMSSRTGEVVRAEDLFDEMKQRVVKIIETSGNKVPLARKEEIAEQVTLGAVKYSFLRVGIGKDIIFDPETSLSLEGDSGPYLQYTYARLKSILRKTGGNEKAPEGVSMDDLEHRLTVAAMRFPETIEDALKNFSPNVLANYLFNLAKLANEFYHSHPVAQESDADKKQFRIALVAAVALTLAKGLNLLGIEAPEEM